MSSLDFLYANTSRTAYWVTHNWKMPIDTHKKDPTKAFFLKLKDQEKRRDIPKHLARQKTFRREILSFSQILNTTLKLWFHPTHTSKGWRERLYSCQTITGNPKHPPTPILYHADIREDQVGSQDVHLLPMVSLKWMKMKIRFIKICRTQLTQCREGNV